MTMADKSFHHADSYTSEEEMKKINSENLDGSQSYLELEDIINISSIILEKIFTFNDCHQSNNIFSKFSQFDSLEFPEVISIRDYMSRVVHYIKCEKDILILSMMTLDRFLEMNSDFVLSRYNCYK